MNLKASQEGIKQAKIALAEMKKKFRNYSQQFLADQAGVSRGTVHSFLHGEEIRELNFINICQVLGLKWEEISYKTDSKTSNLELDKLRNPMLSSKYTTRFEDIFEDKIENFFGRSYVIEDFEKFTESDSGYYILRGEPGEGKSSILAKYAFEHKCLYYFNRRSLGQNTAALFLENICNQLIECYALNQYQEKKSWPSGATESGFFLNELLKEVRSKTSPNEKIIIVVDALDEVDIEYQKKSTVILYLPKKLPQNTYFFVSARKNASELKGRLQFKNKKEKLLEDFPDSVVDIKDFIESFFKNNKYQETLSIWLNNRGINQQIFIDELTGNKTTDLKITKHKRKPERNFMFVDTIMRELSKPDGMYQNAGFEKLPSNLEDYYDDHWILMEIDADKCRIICVICESKQPTPANILSIKSGIDQVEVELVLKFWGQFLRDYKIDSSLFYSLYHESYRDFVYKKPEVKSACKSPQQVNAGIADRYIEEFEL